MARVLLLVPPMQKNEMFARGAKTTASYLPPLGLAYIAAYLRKHDHSCEIYDGVAQPCDIQTLCARAATYDIIGISVVSAYYLRAAEVLSALRNFSPNMPPILVGGPHSTYVPESLLRVGADIAVIGEGEQTSLELVEALASGGRAAISNIGTARIAGIAYLDGSGSMVKTERRIPIPNLDDIPLPARDLLPMHLYGTSVARSTATPSHSMLSSRGCSGICSFCNHAMFGKAVRRISPQRAVEEMYELKNVYKAKSIALWDDNFIEEADYAQEVLGELVSRKFDLSLSVEARADSVDLKTLQLLKKAGGDYIAFGFECGSERLLAQMKKKLKIEQMYQAVSLAKQAGLKIRGYFMMGFPSETYEEIQATIQLAKDLNIDIASFTLLVPFPGTLDYVRATKHGQFDPKFYEKMIVSEINFLKKPIYVPEGMTAEGLLRLHKSAYSQYYFRPSVIIKKLTEVRSVNDVVNLMKGGYTLMANSLASVKG